MTDDVPNTRRRARARGACITTIVATAALLSALGCAKAQQGGVGHATSAAAAPLAGATADSAGAAAAANDAMQGMAGMARTHGAASREARDMDGMSHMSPDMAAHMRLTPARGATGADSARADSIVTALRGAIGRYRDYRAALADGYRIFLPDVPQRVYHFTSRPNAIRAAFGFDATRPTSLLYRRTPAGYELVGAMYTAPYRATLDDLNARVPLGIARWHLHTNLCLPPRGRMDRLRETKDGRPLFGLRGSITTGEACAAEGGRFLPHVFGWMVHVDPFTGEWAENTR